MKAHRSIRAVLRVPIAVAAISLGLAAVSSTPAFAAITQPATSGSPATYIIPVDTNDNALPFTIVANGFAANQAGGFAWLVARDASGILGYGYYGPFRTRAAYRYTVEDSVYIRDGVRGQGVGKALVKALLDRAQAQGFKQMLALIGDSENTASIGVHASLGFHHCGTMRKAGQKFDRWLDVVIMQKEL